MSDAMTHGEVSTARLSELVASAGVARPCTSPEVDPEAWFPIGRPRTRVERQAAEAEAARLCADCPVAGACLELALRYEADSPAYGIWGGTREWTREETNPYRESNPSADDPIAGGGGLMWDRDTKHSEVDVLLPLELEDLASSRPGPKSSRGYAASWYLRKAGLFARLRDVAHVQDPGLARTAHTESSRAERIGLAMATDVVRELATDLDVSQDPWATTSHTEQQASRRLEEVV